MRRVFADDKPNRLHKTLLTGFVNQDSKRGDGFALSGTTKISTK
jgi:hypothetical protein